MPYPLWQGWFDYLGSNKSPLLPLWERLMLHRSNPNTPNSETKTPQGIVLSLAHVLFGPSECILKLWSNKLVLTKFSVCPLLNSFLGKSHNLRDPSTDDWRRSGVNFLSWLVNRLAGELACSGILTLCSPETAKTSGFVLCFLHGSPNILLAFLYFFTSYFLQKILLDEAGSSLLRPGASGSCSLGLWLLLLNSVKYLDFSWGPGSSPAVAVGIWFCSWSTTAF